MPRRALSAIALSTLLVLLTGCTLIPNLGSLGGGGGIPSQGSVTVHALYAAGESGGVSDQRISMSPSDDGDLRIDFSENEVTGFGDMTRAASWNAVTVATLLTGAPLDRQYRFAFDGNIDGPSAGALTTVGVLSMLLGDQLDAEVTMTGTINPTGTIGTVGGIPEKIQGVIDAGEITTVLIPAGQRNTPDHTGTLVDVIDLGAGGGVEVVEVGTIYEAYQRMTGEELPSPGTVSDPRIDEVGYDKLAAGAVEALARFDRAAAEFAILDPFVRANAQSLVDEAAATAQRARDLQVQGLQAGAFIEAHNAAAAMEATYNTFDTVQSLIISGFGALDAKLVAGQTSVDEFNAFVDSLGTYQPQNLTDAEALITAYGGAFDAYSVLQFGQNALQAAFDNAAAGAYTSIDQLLQAVLMPLIYFEFGRAQLTFAKSVFDIGRDNTGGEITVDAEQLTAIGSFLRRGADANWAAFETGVIAPNASGGGVSNDVFRSRLSSIDFDVALSYAAQTGQAVIEQYIGEGKPNAAYAAMGYGNLNYARNAILIEKYYNNGVLDDQLQLVGVNSETILSTALDLGRTQVARAVDVMAVKGTTSVLTVGSFEQAGVDREGTVADKFAAISSYSGAFMMARTLAMIGGYPTAGWKR